jgi:hypothetical protein
LLNFSSKLLTFLSRSWIDFLTSFIYLLGLALWSFLTVGFWILSQIFQLIHYIWIQMLNCCRSLDVSHCFGFSYLNFLCCDLCICLFKFPFMTLGKWRAYCNKKINNSAINQVFEWVRNNWNPYLSPQ